MLYARFDGRATRLELISGSNTKMSNGMVLQGYFQIEQRRRAGHAAAAGQPTAAPRPEPPRSELLPAKMRGETAQAQAARGPGATSSGASAAVTRPALPGMGPATVGGQPRVVQARASQAISARPVPAGQLRVIGAGRPLEPAIRQTMEAFFQSDFSEVQVHEGATARSIGARYPCPPVGQCPPLRRRLSG